MLRVVFLFWFMLVAPVVCRLFGMWVVVGFVLFDELWGSYWWLVISVVA